MPHHIQSLQLFQWIDRLSCRPLASPPKNKKYNRNLLFEGAKLFSWKTDDTMCTLKDSRATLRSLGVYTRVTEEAVEAPNAAQHLPQQRPQNASWRISKPPRCLPLEQSSASPSHQTSVTSKQSFWHLGQGSILTISHPLHPDPPLRKHLSLLHCMDRLDWTVEYSAQ